MVSEAAAPTGPAAAAVRRQGLARVWRGSPDGHPPLWLWARLPALLAAMGLPLLLASAHTYDLAQAAATYAILAAGYSVVLGLCGQFSVAHAALYGTGAYTTAILTTDPHGQPAWVALLASALVAGLAGAIVGLPALRVRGDQLAVITLFIGGVWQIAAQNAGRLTGGYGGIVAVPRISLAGHRFASLHDRYLLAAATLAVVVVLVERVRRSAAGVALIAVRDDEVAARSAGVAVGACKVAAFAASGAVAGVAGWLYAGNFTVVTPARFDITLSVLVAVMVLLAGAGRTYAAVAAAGLLGTLERILSDHSGIEEGATGAAIILVVLWRSGAVRDLLRRAARWRSR